MLNRIHIKQIDAFTTTPFQGNPAAVVNDASKLDSRQMQSIAREMNLSETAFVLPPTVQGADLQLRWFTPLIEVPLCGHATIAAFHSLAEDGLYGMEKHGTYNFQVETKSGILPVEVIKSEEKIGINLGLIVPTKFERYQAQKLDIIRILNLNISDVDPKILILRSEYLIVPIRRLHVLYSIKPNYFAVTNFLNQRNLQGICVFTQETIDRESLVHLRFFAPNEGIQEDPVTGSAHGPLAVFLFENNLLAPVNGVATYIAEQGDVLGRKGRINVTLSVENNKVQSIKIGGYAVTVFETDILIPNKQ
ncbi:MAG: PhzF family phenazine biosynthesis protein [Bacteroidota bacterium]|nr:PhzF family phenazine biosynthesis protein [Bacteroidota bacterium]